MKPDNNGLYVGRPTGERPDSHSVSPASRDQRFMRYNEEDCPEGMSIARFQKLLKWKYDDSRWMWRDEDSIWHLVICGKEVCSSNHIQSFDAMRWLWEDEEGYLHLVHMGDEVAVARRVRSYSSKRFAYFDDGLWHLVHGGSVVASGVEVQSYEMSKWAVMVDGKWVFHGCSGFPDPMAVVNPLNKD